MAIVKGSEYVPLFDTWPQWNATRCRETFGPSSLPLCPETDLGELGKVASLELDTTAVVIASQMITALAHALQAGLMHHRPRWSVILNRRGVKWLFWVEYCVSASLIGIVVTYYSGLIGVREQLLVVSGQSSLMLLGLLLDLLRYVAVDESKERRHLSWVFRALCGWVFVVGFYNVLVVWIPGIARLFGHHGATEAPEWVVYLVLAEASLYMSFGIVELVSFVPFLMLGVAPSVQWLEMEQGAMIILSFASKFVLNAVFSVCLVYGVC